MRILAIALSVTLILPARFRDEVVAQEPTRESIVIAMEKAFASVKVGGRIGIASGFVTSYKGRKVIITAGHLFRGGIGDVTVSFPNSQKKWSLLCDEVDYSDELDLLALVPRDPLEIPCDVIPLEIDTGYEVNHRANPTILVYGTPHGSSSPRTIPGIINAPVITAAELPEKWYTDVMPHQRTPRGPTYLIQHDAHCMEGVSGAPVLNSQGKVIAIQTGLMPVKRTIKLAGDGALTIVDGERSVAYAVSARHLPTTTIAELAGPAAEIRRLDLGRAPDPKFEKALSILKHDPKSIYHAVSVAEVNIPIDKDTELELRFVNEGRLPRVAGQVLTPKYIREPAVFRKAINDKQLQDYLDKHSLSLITNAELGFSLFLPDSCKFEVHPLDEKEGFHLEVLKPGPLGSPSDGPLTELYVYNALEYYKKNRLPFDLEAIRVIDDLQDKHPDAILNKRLIAWNVIKKCMLPEIVKNVEKGLLQCISKGDDTLQDIRAPDRILKKRLDVDVSSDFVDRYGVANVWNRVNYVDSDTGTVDAIHCGIREDCAFVFVYRTTQADIESLNKGKAISERFIEQRIIRASLSLY